MGVKLGCVILTHPSPWSPACDFPLTLFITSTLPSSSTPYGAQEEGNRTISYRFIARMYPISSAMSAGRTPGTRDAWPTVAGRSRPSFSRLSKLRPFSTL